MSGSSGWVELANTSAAAVDLAGDPASCWFVDDGAGGGAPRAITDANVNHPEGSTACAAAGRGAACGLVAPGEHVWVKISFINSVTPDACRLLAAPRSGGTCGGTPADIGVGGPTASTDGGAVLRTAARSRPLVGDRDRVHAGRGQPVRPGRLPGARAGVGADAGADASPDATSIDAAAGAARTPDDAAAEAGVDSGWTRDGRRRDAAADAGLPSGPPAITRIGLPDRLLLAGTVVTPDVAFEGEVLIVGDTIACVAPSCAADPAAADATVVETNGIIFPGLIDTHNHILFDIFDETDWSPTKLYTNHNQWPNEPRYKAMVDAKQYLNGEAGSPVSIGCEMDKYGELKALIAGTTSVVGSANPANRACYGSLARTIDQTPNGLGVDRIQAATIFPSTSAADCGVREPRRRGDRRVRHPRRRGRRRHRRSRSSTSSARSPAPTAASTTPRTTIVHGTALGDAELTAAAAHGMSLVWSPRSNVFLYGGGTDLTKTANIPLALAKGINVALAPDWSIGGSQNLLDELRFADRVDDAVWGDAIAPRALVQMVTTNAARALGLGGVLGALAAGKKADVLVVGGDRAHPYDALLAATPARGAAGDRRRRALYGDAVLARAWPRDPGLRAARRLRRLQVRLRRRARRHPANKLGQTLHDVTDTIAVELQRYDDLNLSAWNFSPPTPLVRCGP